MKNALTIDVEEYFQVAVLADAVPRARWESMPSRIEASMSRLLELLAEHRVQATFFTLGWIAQRHPRLVREIVAGGHELASHGFDHRNVHQLGPQAFFDDLSRARGVLEEVASVEVRGYRAPNFSVDRRTPWAHEMIARAGHRYSSSTYPARAGSHRIGEPHPHQTPWGVTEIPITAAWLGGRQLPAGGGGYFRLLPYRASRWMIRHINSRQRQPAVFYLHPWELDPDQPRMSGLSLDRRLRHYVNLEQCEARLRRLLKDFSWGRMDEVFA